MQTVQQIQLTDELKAHLTLNAGANVYSSLPMDFRKENGKWGFFIEFEKLKDYHLTDAQKNLILINERIANRQEFTEILLGDIIRYKDGRKERVTHVWEDGQCQAGGWGGSYYMAKSGGASYSGGLNSGLHIDQLELTTETEPVMFWMFSRDWSGANRGIYFYCPVKIWAEK